MPCPSLKPANVLFPARSIVLVVLGTPVQSAKYEESLEDGDMIINKLSSKLFKVCSHRLEKFDLKELTSFIKEEINFPFLSTTEFSSLSEKKLNYARKLVCQNSLCLSDY